MTLGELIYLSKDCYLLMNSTNNYRTYIQEKKYKEKVDNGIRKRRLAINEN